MTHFTTFQGSGVLSVKPSQERPLPFDSLASEYDAWFDGDGRLIFDIEVKALKEAALPLSQPGLEIGVGSGRFARALEIGFGLDPAVELLRMAMDRGIRVVRGRGEKAPFLSGKFESIFLITTLCFLPKPVAALEEAERLLTDHGQLLIGMVPAESTWGKLYQIKKNEGHPIYQHATFYSYEKVNELLGEAGFTISNVVATLFQSPGKVHHIEAPKQGYYPDAGFLAIMARKS